MERLNATEANPDALAASRSLYSAVRGAFISRGTSLNQWCDANDVHRQEVRRAFLGIRTTPHYVALRARVLSEAGFSAE